MLFQFRLQINPVRPTKGKSLGLSLILNEELLWSSRLLVMNLHRSVGFTRTALRKDRLAYGSEYQKTGTLRLYAETASEYRVLKVNSQQGFHRRKEHIG